MSEKNSLSDPSKWMESIRDDVSIAALNIPGTHNSGSDRSNGFLSKYVQCQHWSIAEQLRQGIRYLDIRCYLKGNSLGIIHGLPIKKDFSRVLDAIQTFLAENKGETVIMKVKHARSQISSHKRFKKVFEDYQARFPQLKWYVSHTIPDMASARGKVILIQEKNILGQGLPKESPLIEKKHIYQVDYDEKWDFIVTQLNKAYSDKSEKLYFISCNSTMGSGAKFLPLDFLLLILHLNKSPMDFSKNLIPKVIDFLDKQAEGRYGVLSFDYPTPLVIEKIISLNQHKMKQQPLS